ncbi:hypothetical protein [Labilibacter marinus]|uniref:hypothetical protein n=1 Tax=Labilibacter marinus TaxID=1477105 RepID=UPI00082EC4DD|nr:hypothetical protein [Labilibacter marinus]
MNTTIYKLLFFSFILAYCSNAKGQDYKNLVSLKTGVYTGFNYKRLLPNETAFSAQLGFRDGGITLNAYRTFHQLAFPKKQNYQLFLFYGYGAHFRYYTRYKRNNPFKPWRPTNEYRGNYFAAGLDGIIGLEYRFLKYPFVISTDINPNFEFGGATAFKVNMDLISIGLGYTF